MPNQYVKIPLFLEDDTNISDFNITKNLSIAVIDSLKDILPKDIEDINLLINKIKDEL
ncbi:MAG: hypothetical protein SOY04_04555 [Clostridium celatum]|nr:hypothetical protein [Clostridium saudiense]MBM6859966.1 hypothetical protein [Clostridium saudiense]MDY3359664.1 hypothetical protein [Clostridium celatum]